MDYDSEFFNDNIGVVGDDDYFIFVARLYNMQKQPPAYATNTSPHLHAMS